MALKKKVKTHRKSMGIRLSEKERTMLARLQQLFGTETDSQTLRKILRDTATELGIK